MAGLVNLSDSALWTSALSIVLTPTWWNITARLEYRTHFLTKLCGGKYAGAYLLAFAIFMVSNLRTYLCALVSSYFCDVC